MQQTGTIRKRKRRNISKVKGLSISIYDEAADIYDGMTLFGISSGESSSASRHVDNPLVTEFGRNSIAMRMNSFAFRQSRDGSNSKRVTRNPEFHADFHTVDNIYDGTCTWSRNASTFASESNNGSLSERSHFFDQLTMSRLKLTIWIGVISGTYPWKWDQKSFKIQKFSPTAEKIWKGFYFVFFIQTVCLFLFQIYSFVHSYKISSHVTYRETFMSSVAVCWYIYHLYFSINLILYRDKTRHYINTLLEFNKEYVDKYVIHLDGYDDGKMNRLILRYIFPVNTMQPFVSVLFFLVMPFQPWYLFSYIYPKPWYFLIPGVIQEFILIGIASAGYLIFAWVAICHCNAITFWLQETHNYNDSDFTIDELRHPKTAIETYKALQILCGMFNECMFGAIPAIKFSVFTATISCGYVIIRSMNHLFVNELPASLTYPATFLDASTVGFGLLTMAAQMYDLASSFIDSWSRTKNKGFRRILMSLPNLKLRVGRFYFITVTTTITFFQVIFGYITDAIITFP